MPDRGAPTGDPVNIAAHVATPQWQSFETRMRLRRAGRCLQRAAAAIESGQLADANEALDEARELNPRAPELESLFDRLAAMQAAPAAASYTAGAIAEPALARAPETFSLSAIENDQPAVVPPEPREAQLVETALEEPLADEAAVPAFVRTLKPPLQLDLDPVEPVDLHPLHPREPVDLHPLHTGAPLRMPMPAPTESRSWLRATAVGGAALGLSAFAGWLAITQWPALVRPSETRADISLPASGQAAVVQEPAPPAVLDETGIDLQAATPVPGTAEAPASTSESLEAADPVPATSPEPTGESATISPRSDVPRTEVESTSGRVPPSVVPAPSVPPPSPELVPRIVEEAPRTPPQPATADASTAPAAVSSNAGSAASAPAISDPNPPAVPDSPRAATTADSTPPPPAPEAAPRPVPAAVDERAAVRTTLSRYEAAYSSLDSAGAKAVWPTVDQRALAHAFDGLAAQRVALGTCEVGVNGQSARAICVGKAAWTPKVGGGQQTKSRTWTFDLRRSDTTWQIVRVDTR